VSLLPTTKDMGDFPTEVNKDIELHCTTAIMKEMGNSSLKHQSPGYFDHVSEVIVIIFKTYFENDQNILTSSSSMGFLPIKLMIINILTFSFF
jgi:hypothetical protein